MIDRKTLRILLLIIAAMTAVAVWRLSLLPDWTQVPFKAGRNGPHIENGLVLFAQPLGLLFVTAIALATRRLISGPEEAIHVHQRRNRLMLLGTGLIAALMHTFVISRSLDYGNDLDSDAVSRTMMVVIAILVMIQGNNMPKLPWISSRIPAFQLDRWQSARSKRFTGRLSIAMGLIMIGAAALAPVRITPFILMGACLLYVGATFWYALRLKREASAQS